MTTKSTKKKIKIICNCNYCDGTGLFVDELVVDGCAIVCPMCEGTGKKDVTYKRFIGRQVRRGIKRVFKSCCGYLHSADNAATRAGKLIEFEKGGCTYEEWLNGAEPMPVKDLYCPYVWMNRGLQWRDVNDLYKNRCSESTLSQGCSISLCVHFADKAVCWAIFEGIEAT